MTLFEQHVTVEIANQLKIQNQIAISKEALDRGLIDEESYRKFLRKGLIVLGLLNDENKEDI